MKRALAHTTPQRLAAGKRWDDPEMKEVAMTRSTERFEIRKDQSTGRLGPVDLDTCPATRPIDPVCRASLQQLLTMPGYMRM
jgi:hypothetical protein